METKEGMMVLPFIGPFKMWWSLFSLSLTGRPNNTGFVIKNWGKKIAKTERYNESESRFDDKYWNRIWMEFFAIQLFVFFLVLIFFTENPFWIKIAWLSGMSLFFIISSAIIAVCLEFKLDKERREYHGCEHKTICLIYEGLEPTLENLKKMPKTNIACGSSNLILILGAFFFLSLSIFLGRGNVEYVSQLTAFAGHLIIAFWVGLFCSIPLIQSFCVLKEPRESRLQEGLEAAKRAYEVLHGAH